ncbi:MAG: methionyl-tRNA formyltransferase [Pseudomonadota bacterium]
MRVVFMGTPDFSVPALEALVAAGHDVAAVYCQPPRRAGRGKSARLTPVHARGLALGLEVRHPRTLKDPEAQADLAALAPEVAVVVAYGLLLPQAVLDVPQWGCLNIHASLLPRWRGAAPIHRAVMAGDAQTGICIMQMEAGLDTGPVLARVSVPIGPEATTGVLHDALSVLGAGMIVDVLADLPMAAVPQVEDGVTYAHKIDKTEARIDWTRSSVEVDRQIRGLSPFPGAWTEVAGERLKLLGSRVVEGVGEAGEVLEAPLVVACGSGAVEVLRAQRAGRGAQDAADLLRGFALPPGTRMT